MSDFSFHFRFQDDDEPVDGRADVPTESTASSEQNHPHDGDCFATQAPVPLLFAPPEARTDTHQEEDLNTLLEQLLDSAAAVAGVGTESAPDRTTSSAGPAFGAAMHSDVHYPGYPGHSMAPVPYPFFASPGPNVAVPEAVAAPLPPLPPAPTPAPVVDAGRCPHCHQTFLGRLGLALHMRKRHPAAVAPVPPPLPPPPVVVFPAPKARGAAAHVPVMPAAPAASAGVCHECRRDFVGRLGLALHRQKMHAA